MRRAYVRMSCLIEMAEIHRIHDKNAKIILRRRIPILTFHGNHFRFSSFFSLFSSLFLFHLFLVLLAATKTVRSFLRITLHILLSSTRWVTQLWWIDVRCGRIRLEVAINRFMNSIPPTDRIGCVCAQKYKDHSNWRWRYQYGKC